MKPRRQISILMLALALPVLAFGQTESEPNNSTAQADPLPHLSDITGQMGNGCTVADNTADYFAINTPQRGRLRIRTGMSNSGPAPLSVTVNLLNASGSFIGNFTTQAGANNTVVLDSATFNCQGQGLYYIYLTSPSASLCTDYTLSYEMLPPVFADDLEGNNSIPAADTVAANTDHDGTVDFTYGDNIDYYRIILPNDGVLSVNWQGEHAGTTASTATLTLYTNSGSFLQSWTVPVGANSTPATDLVTIDCRGNELMYVLRVSSNVCGTSYRFNYAVQAPVFADDDETGNGNDGTASADTVAVDSLVQGRLNFYYDDNNDYYRLILDDDGVLNISTLAEHASASSTDSLTLYLYNNSGSFITQWRVPVGANSTPAARNVSVTCRGNELHYYLRLVADACGASYQFSYNVTPPVFAEDQEPNDGTAQADTVAVDSLVQGRLNFFYDDNIDYYRLVLNDDGELNITTLAEHASNSVTDSLTLTLYNNSGSFVTQWRVPVGANSTPASGAVSITCRGNELHYNLRILADACGASYQFSYNVTSPVFADDQEPNDGAGSAQVIDLDMASVPGRLNFFYDDDADYFRLTLATSGVLTLDLQAERSGSAGAVDLSLLNSFGSFIQNQSMNVGGGSTPVTTTFVSNSLAAGDYIVRLSGAPCGTSYSFNCFDDDNDGTCNFFDLCPGGPEPGTPCDDNSACTTNDVIQSDCSCAGTPVDPDDNNACTIDSCDPVLGVINTPIDPDDGDPCTLDSCDPVTGVSNVFQDADNDGTCDANDLCPGGPEPGTLCDDGDVCTTGDVIQSDCGCSGTFQDADNDGTCDANDLCPGSPEPGQGCDDGDPNTINDVVDANCNCAGTPLTVDCEGTPGGTALPGTPCDDNSLCTINDTWDANCNCTGTSVDPDDNNACTIDSCDPQLGVIHTPVDPDDGDPCTLDSCDPVTGVSNVFQDADNDGTCDANDLCPGGPEPGQGCDDGDPNTINDVVDANCNCAGTPLNVDCEGTPGGTALPGTPCDDNSLCTTNDTWDANCNCTGTPVDPDDNNACTIDSCDPVLGVINTPIDPDDGDPCTLDSCDPVTGVSNVFQDADNDGTCDANDLCPGGPEPGQSCDDGDPNTINDVVDANCTCAGTPSGGCTENLTLQLFTDGNGAQTSWAILPLGGGAPLCSGSGYPDNTTTTVGCCLLPGCYRLEVYDSFGDGMTTGGYVLTNDQNERIIDNSQNGNFGSLSALANGGGFCLPIGGDRIVDSDLGGGFGCDRMDYSPTDYFTAKPNNAVVASNGDGYQFWIFEPNGSYSRRVFQSGTVNNGWPNSDPNDACYLRFGNLNTLPVPLDVPLNLRVRTRISGNFGNFGPACLAMVLSTPPNCPTTRLVDNPNNPNFSCGVTRSFGGSDNVTCFPVAGANKYQFRFENAGENFVRTIASNTPVRPLAWNTLPLQPGVTYAVTVRASFDGGLNWCPFGTACDVTIAAPASFAARGSGMDIGTTSMLVWPNPVRDNSVYIRIQGLDVAHHDITIDIHDLFGKRVLAQELDAQGEGLNLALELPLEMAPGVYLVNVTVDGNAITQRLVRQ